MAYLVSIPIGKLSLIGHQVTEAHGGNPYRFNSHWEVESHWTLLADGGRPNVPGVSIPIGKLSLIGRSDGQAVVQADWMFQFPLGS